MHELLEYLLSVTGPAFVRITSYSITEVAVRTFLRLVENKSIIDLECIFDLSVKQHKAGLLFFASNITPKIALTKCHAKLMLILNDDWILSVVSSANLQVNDKIEAGIIVGDASVFNFYKDRFNKTFDKSLKISKDDFN